MNPFGSLTYDEWRQRHAITLGGVKEVITQPLWHRQAYTSAATTELTFFNVATTGLTGNLRLGGQLPNGYEYLIMALGITIELEPTETASAVPADGLANGAILSMSQLITRGWAELKIGEKPYGEFPIEKLQSGSGVWGGMSNVGTLTAVASSQMQFANNGPPDIRAVYSLSRPLLVPSQFGFTVTLRWPVAITLVPAQNPFVKVWIDGEMARPAQ